MKNVLAIMGSPRKNKNTDILLGELLHGIKMNIHNKYNIKRICLRDKKIAPCISCGSCENTGECIINDDMIDIYEEFEKNDIIILASPLYFNTVSTLTKTIIDRCQKYWSKKHVLTSKYQKIKNKTGIFLCVGGAKFTCNHFSSCIPTIDLFFKAIDARYSGNYLVSNTDNISVSNRKEVLSEIYKIGENINNVFDFYLHR